MTEALTRGRHCDQKWGAGEWDVTQDFVAGRKNSVFTFGFVLIDSLRGPNRWVLWVLGIRVLNPVGIGYWVLEF